MNADIKRDVAVESLIIIRNCENCELFGSDDNGDYPEFAISWPVCNKTYCQNLDEGIEDNTDKPGFPFTTDQPCHVPGFWQYAALDQELSALFDAEVQETSTSEELGKFDKTYARFKEKYGLQNKVGG